MHTESEKQKVEKAQHVLNVITNPFGLATTFVIIN